MRRDMSMTPTKPCQGSWKTACVDAGSSAVGVGKPCWRGKRPAEGSRQPTARLVRHQRSAETWRSDVAMASKKRLQSLSGDSMLPSLNAILGTNDTVRRRW